MTIIGHVCMACQVELAQPGHRRVLAPPISFLLATVDGPPVACEIVECDPAHIYARTAAGPLINVRDLF